jgi:hypothetical protein
MGRTREKEIIRNIFKMGGKEKTENQDEQIQFQLGKRTGQKGDWK